MVKVFIEGGGDSEMLHDELRRGFRMFFLKAGCKGNMPRIVAGGGREQTYDCFKTAVTQGEQAMLLVDSEAHVTCESPWEHFKMRPGDQNMTKPQGASDKDDDVYLMVCCMESWFLADRDALKAYFGQGYNENALPDINNPVESNSKQSVLDGLKNATRHCKTKRPYAKGEHSFALIGRIDPAKVEQASTWARKLLEKLR